MMTHSFYIGMLVGGLLVAFLIAVAIGLSAFLFRAWVR